MDYPKVELCRIDTFSTYQMTAFRAMIFEQSPSVRYELIEWFSQIELMADAGLKYLVEGILKDSINMTDGRISLIDGVEEELQITLSTFVSSELKKVPF